MSKSARNQNARKNSQKSKQKNVLTQREIPRGVIGFFTVIGVVAFVAIGYAFMRSRPSSADDSASISGMVTKDGQGPADARARGALRRGQGHPVTGEAPRGRRTTVVLAVLVLLTGAVLVALSAARSGDPGTDGPEAGFARDMSAHHAQAVRMSFIVRDRTDDAEVRLLAYDIINTQSAQIGMMTAWLDGWGLPKTDPAGRMRWMSGHGGHASPAAGEAAMPGMATREWLADLEKASGRDAEARFLRLMIAHHRGGVAMAEAVLARTDKDRVRRLARTMVDGQRAEIRQMEGMLRQRAAA